MQLNKVIKMKLIEAGLRQVDVCQRTSISEPRLSHIIYGRVNASDDEQNKIAKALKCETKEIFK